MPTITRIAVDLAKQVFEVACANRAGKVVKRARLRRDQFLSFFADYPGVEVVMEACGSAPYWGRELPRLGHPVRLLPVQHVIGYRPRHRKTDRTDAAALLKAAADEDIHPVAVKSADQQALQALHRVRSGWMKDRTARINQLRGLLREFGLIAPAGAHAFVSQLPRLLDDPELPGRLRPWLERLYHEIRDLEAEMAAVERTFAEMAADHPVIQRLRTIPGIGLLIATALLAAITGLSAFKNGRQLAAWLGLVPSEHSSGQRRRLGGISKVGDGYLRCLFTHGARAVLQAAKRPGAAEADRLKAWALDIEQRRGHNKATLAVANKLARIAFGVWAGQSTYGAAGLPSPQGA